MQRWYRLAAGIDRLSDRLGRGVSWLVLVMVLVGAGNAVVRYLGRSLGADLSSNAYLELQWQLFGLICLLAAGYALRHGVHVRVDVFYGRLGERGRAWIDLLGALVLLLPFCGVALWVSWPTAFNSWKVLEGSPDPGGLPRYPLKTMIPIAFALVALQGISELIKNVAVLRGDRLEGASEETTGMESDGAGEPHL